MTVKLKMSEDSLRKIVREVLDNTAMGDVFVPGVEISNISAQVDDPLGDKENSPVDAIRDDEELGQMKLKDDKDSVEEAVRKEIRNILSEVVPQMDYSYSGPDVYGDEDDEDDESGGPPKRKNLMMTDVDGDTFEEIATELGFSVAGAKQAVDKAILKARFIGQMDHDDREILILKAMKEYIHKLSKTGELSAADVQLMMDHPDIVRDLDGFRDFLHNHFRRAARKMGKKLTDEGKKLKLQPKPKKKVSEVVIAGVDTDSLSDGQLKKLINGSQQTLNTRSLLRKRSSLETKLKKIPFEKLDDYSDGMASSYTSPSFQKRMNGGFYTDGQRLFAKTKSGILYSYNRIYREWQKSE